jgi:hypothetical protein
MAPPRKAGRPHIARAVNAAADVGGQAGAAAVQLHEGQLASEDASP